MKKLIAIAAILALLCTMLAGCGGSGQGSGPEEATAPGGEQAAAGPVNAYDEALQGNFNNGGFFCETPSYIYARTNPYRIDKATGEAEYLCTDPTCFHNTNCISSDAIMQLQSYGERVFGLLFIASDPEVTYVAEVKGKEYDVLYRSREQTHSPRIIDDKLYVFTTVNDISQYKIIDINTKKELKSLVIDPNEKDRVESTQNTFMHENSIYHSNLLNDLKKINTETGEVTLVAQNVIKPQLVGETIYFLRANAENDENRSLYQMDLDGGNEKLVYDDCFEFNVYEDTVYYVPSSYPKSLNSMDLSGENSKVLVQNDEVSYIEVLPQSKKLVFFTQDKGDCTCNFDGSDFKALPLPAAKQ